MLAPWVAAQPPRHRRWCPDTIGRSLLALHLQLQLPPTRRADVLFDALATNKVTDLVTLLLLLSEQLFYLVVAKLVKVGHLQITDLQRTETKTDGEQH